MSVCYVSLFYNLKRDKWEFFNRDFSTYLEHFRPFIDMFSQKEHPEYEMILLLDKHHVDEVKELFNDRTRIRIVEIDQDFLQDNFPMWKTIPKERQVMDSNEFKNIIPERLLYPEHCIPEYTMINHCKIDAISYVINSGLTNAEYFAWVDFGYFQQKDRITKSFIDIRKLDLNCINYTLINPLTEFDKDILYTLINAPERFGGFFFFGSKQKMMEYQKLFHSVLNQFQNELNIADDDQHIAMVCYFKKPKLFKLYCLGGWHRALTHFAHTDKVDKVSVIIPTYNRFSFLINAINSVKNQTYPNIEIIVINDGSSQEEYYTDQLKKILPSNSIWLNLSSNSSYYVGDTGRAAYTRNIGLKLFTGEYVAFLDDDDIWFPEKIEKQIESMKESGCKMSCTESLIGKGVYNTDSIYPKYNTEYFKDFYISINIMEFPLVWDRDFLKIHNSCITSSVILHKNIISKIGIMPYKRVGEDYEYWLRALQYTNCSFVETPLMYYDLNHGEGSLY
jgi:GT2 family glycosyltransferase